MTAEGGLRERKKLATRSALAGAALRLAAEHGVAAVTAEDIAEAAGVSVRTFFNYFATKEEAFVADDLDRGRRFVAAVVAAPPDVPVWDLLHQTAMSTLTTTELASREQALKEQLVRTSPALLGEVLSTFARLEQELVGELARRTAPASPLHVRLLANAVTAAFRATTETWLAGDDELAGRTPDAEAFLALLDEAFRALAPAFRATPSSSRTTTTSPPEHCRRTHPPWQPVSTGSGD